LRDGLREEQVRQLVEAAAAVKTLRVELRWFAGGDDL